MAEKQERPVAIFRGTFAPLASAIQVSNADGGTRVKIDIPECDEDEIDKLKKLRKRVFLFAVYLASDEAADTDKPDMSDFTMPE